MVCQDRDILMKIPVTADGIILLRLRSLKIMKAIPTPPILCKCKLLSCLYRFCICKINFCSPHCMFSPWSVVLLWLHLDALYSSLHCDSSGSLPLLNQSCTASFADWSTEKSTLKSIRKSTDRSGYRGWCDS